MARGIESAVGAWFITSDTSSAAKNLTIEGQLDWVHFGDVPFTTNAGQEHKQAESRNKERQSSLKKDTDQLLQLATELKQSVDKTNEHVLSLDVIKKADEIEKLAKSVKDKMKGPN